jgi:hypothetical protein
MKHTSIDRIRTYRAPGEERLAELAGFLDDLPDGILTFSRWYGHGRGCAVGLAAVHSAWMKAQGLELADDDSLKDCRPVYSGKSDWDAVAAFFEVDLETARRLFSRSGYEGEMRPHPRAVAAAIRRYLALAPVAA